MRLLLGIPAPTAVVSTPTTSSSDADDTPTDTVLLLVELLVDALVPAPTSTAILLFGAVTTGFF